jgi:hypothetical protein
MTRFGAYAFVGFVLAASPAPADPYVVCDNGLRCITAPCPSMNALNIRTRKAGRITGVDLDALSPTDRARLQSSEATTSGALVLAGAVRTREAKAGSSAQPRKELVVSAIDRRSRWTERRLCRRSTVD